MICNRSICAHGEIHNQKNCGDTHQIQRDEGFFSFLDKLGISSSALRRMRKAHEEQCDHQKPTHILLHPPPWNISSERKSKQRLNAFLRVYKVKSWKQKHKSDISPALEVLTASEDHRIKGDGWYSLLTDVLTTTENTLPTHTLIIKIPPSLPSMCANCTCSIKPNIC